MWRTVLLILFERVNLSFDENALLTVVTNPRSFMAVNQGNLMDLLGDGTLLEYDDRQQKAIMQFDVRPEFCHSDVTVGPGRLCAGVDEGGYGARRRECEPWSI